MKQSTDDNNARFNRTNAFDFLTMDVDNVIRIDKVTRFIKSYVSTKKHQQLSMLDVGCGDGSIAERFIRQHVSVVGIDSASRPLIKAKQRGVAAVMADASYQLPFLNEVFDIVFAGEIIEHLYDVERFMTELRRVLKQGGLLVITTPNLVHLPERTRFLRGQSPCRVVPCLSYLKLHIRHFTIGTLRELLRHYHFKEEKIESSMVVFSRNPDQIEEVTAGSKWLAHLFPGFGSLLIGYFRKQ